MIVERLLEREKDNNGGKWPETIALVLWGTDNIKTYGESLAQVGATQKGAGGHAPGMDALASCRLFACTGCCFSQAFQRWGPRH